MHRVSLFGRSLGLSFGLSLGLSLGLAAGPAGCADSGGEGFVIRANLAPGDGCELNASLDAPFITRGLLNTRSGASYLLNPLIQSRIVAATGQESVRTVALMGAKVELAIGPITIETPDSVTTVCTAEGASACFAGAEADELAAAGVTRFRSLFAAPLAPNGGLTGGTFDLVPTSAIRAVQRKAGALDAGARLRAQVVATATVYGDLGGDEIEGAPFVYPVTICDDCVINNVGACAATSTEFEARTGNACNPFQDGVIDCCTGDGGGLVCPAVGTMEDS